MKKIILSLLLLLNCICVRPVLAGNCDQWVLPYNTAVVLPFCLKNYDSTEVVDNKKVSFQTGATFTAGDVVVNCDNAGDTNVGTLPTDRGNCYSQPLSAAETSCLRGTVNWVDQTASAVWIPHCAEFVTYNSSSAFHAGASRANVIQWNSHNVVTEDINGAPVVTVSDGTGAGQIDTTSGKIASVASVDAIVGNVGGNVVGTIGGMTVAALKDFFDTNSTTTFASAVAGSVVGEIANNCSGGGGGSCTNGGWTTHVAQAISKTTAKLASTDTYGQNAIAENTTFHIVSTSTGTGKGQSQRICLYTAATNTITFCKPLQILPVGTVTYQLIPETDK